MRARDRMYFANSIRDERMLRTRGFDAWPDVEELARYVFALEERVDALASVAGAGPGRDAGGGLCADRREGVS